jgi:hypothetical protein
MLLTGSHNLSDHLFIAIINKLIQLISKMP